ncbi:inositol utilization protein [Bosea caraganae]|uniref:Inositol utilization protein n=1 Tax=Bosea caraganae TaxID=2763117 RepID=A0A370KXV4_9HYPH|nr:5-deoxy-glucuronate isomerase [Bosea caraganae]RDJ19807.1 inositol utilization protein [Bosea caraganae]RDJ30053.1 inositol utilization protein [Bosea caraganae]
MPKHVRASDNANRAIVTDDPALPHVYFNLLKLGPGEALEQTLPTYESVYVVLSGTADIIVDGERFGEVGKRRDIWSGEADSVYAPVGSKVRLENATGPVEIAVAGGLCEDDGLKAFRILPGEVSMVDVGSPETHSRRRIFHILGQNGEGRAGNLLVSELYADPGCWSGYPPHKHDADRDGETAHDELYHYRYDPGTGFGAQIIYADGKAECFMVQDRDTILVDRGYHPTVTSPGHRCYIFTILVGKTQRGLVQHFDDRHAHLMAAIPGIQSMRDKFK